MPLPPRIGPGITSPLFGCSSALCSCLGAFFTVCRPRYDSQVAFLVGAALRQRFLVVYLFTRARLHDSVRSITLRTGLLRLGRRMVSSVFFLVITLC